MRREMRGKSVKGKDKPIPFMKLSGSGNDFILIDNRERVVAPRRAGALAAKVCAHRMSVGGDGLILIERSRRADFRWRLFNADGIEAELVAGLPGRKGRTVRDAEAVKVRFPDPTGLRLHLRVPIAGVERDAHFIDTGVPHCVYLVDDPDTVDVVGIGRPTRHHPLFLPAGTNVNFIRIVDPHRIRIRTYERGVEDETLACGTGAIASALIASLVGKVESPVTLVPQSGLELTVHFGSGGGTFTEVYLQGDARAVSEGRILPDAWL